MKIAQLITSTSLKLNRNRIVLIFISAFLIFWLWVDNIPELDDLHEFSGVLHGNPSILEYGADVPTHRIEFKLMDGSEYYIAGCGFKVIDMLLIKKLQRGDEINILIENTKSVTKSKVYSLFKDEIPILSYTEYKKCKNKYNIILIPILCLIIIVSLFKWYKNA